MTTDLLSPNMKALDLIGTQKYLNVCLSSMICSVAVLAARNSHPYVAFSMVASILNTNQLELYYQSVE